MQSGFSDFKQQKLASQPLWAPTVGELPRQKTGCLHLSGSGRDVFEGAFVLYLFPLTSVGAPQTDEEAAPSLGRESVSILVCQGPMPFSNAGLVSVCNYVCDTCLMSVSHIPP